MQLKDLIPSLSWIQTYSSSDFKGDLAAGLTVGVMLIPQGMAYAMIAGMPPIYGLYAASIPLIIYALLGTSRQLAVGPVAMVSLMIASGVGLLAEQGSDNFIALAILLAFMVGIIQFLMGVLRLGFLVKFLSHPVIAGFTSAAALIIGLSQLKHLLGINIPRTHHVHEILINAIKQLGEVNPITFLIGLLGIVLIVLLKKIHRSVPSQLIVVIVGILAVVIFNLHENGVKIIGDIPKGLPSFQLPQWEMTAINELLLIAMAISLVSFMESIAVAKAIQAKHQSYVVDPNKELIALGTANIVGSFFKSFVVTGGFSRTAVNDQAGAKTGFAAIISAGLIILTLMFLTPMFYYLPKALLASIIMVAVFGLIDFKEAKFLWRANKTDFWMFVATFIATLLLGIEKGIGTGVIISLAMVIFRASKPHVAELGQINGTHIYRNVKRFSDLIVRKDILIVRFDAQLFFANVQYFREFINRLAKEKGDDLKLIILNGESVNNIDSSAVHLLYEIIDRAKEKKVKIFFTGVHGPVRDALEKAKLVHHIGRENFFLSVQEAVDYYDNSKSKSIIDA